MKRARRGRGRRRGWLVWLGPLLGPATISLLGSLLFLSGLIITVRTVLFPILRAGAAWWHQMVGTLLMEDWIELSNHLLGGMIMIGGAYLMFAGVRSFIRRTLGILSPTPVQGVVDSFRRRRELLVGPKIVALGGGTGLSNILRGLKHYSSNITAIVCVSDDGGSSGRLVTELGMLPPGDIRNCLLALSDSEATMAEVFQHRFNATAGALSGHNLGNLFMVGMLNRCNGDVDEAIRKMGEVLNIRGRVLPATIEHVRLEAEMADGSTLVGETDIVKHPSAIKSLRLSPAHPAAHPEAVAAIQQADMIVIGPGSVYTSVLPNLLVPGLAEALRNADCPRVYVCNVMTQPGESDGFSAADHVAALTENAGEGLFDTVLVNTGLPAEGARERYAKSGQLLVAPDSDRIRSRGLRVVEGNMVSQDEEVRHETSAVAALLINRVKVR
ncbi:MAG: YvcK family protein [Fimbriimonadaceae bacterium]|nr:YvcK family protein [Fimbriimonadaceae bacterium]